MRGFIAGVPLAFCGVVLLLAGFRDLSEGRFLASGLLEVSLAAAGLLYGCTFILRGFKDLRRTSG